MPGGAELRRDEVEAEVERVLAGRVFTGQGRSAGLLRYLVAETLAGRGRQLKEYALAVEALGRPADFDPASDPIARVEASRLRKRLELYYELEGVEDPVVIALPKGGYALTVERRRPADGGIRPRRSRRLQAVWALAAAAGASLAIAAVVAVLSLRPPAAPAEPIRRLEVELVRGQALASDVGSDLAVAPDGRLIAFVARDAAGATRLLVRDLAAAAPREIPQTLGARGPFFSPDGAWIGFWSDGWLRKAPVGGGEPIALTRAADLLGAAWLPDGDIVAVLDSSGRLYRLSSAGGAPRPWVDLRSERRIVRWPDALPDGRVLITALGPLGPDAAEIRLVSADGRRSVTLVRGGTFGRYLAGGRLLYVRDGRLLESGLDAGALGAPPAAASLASDVAYSAGWGYAHLAVSRGGLVAYRRSRARSVLAWIEPSGTTLAVNRPGRYLWPRLSPDGRRVAVTVEGGGLARIDVFDLATGAVTHLSPNVARASTLWSADGRNLIVATGRGMAWMPADGSGRPRPLLRHDGVQVPWSLSPGGARVAYGQMSPDSAFDLWSAALRQDGAGLAAIDARPILQTRSFETYPAISQDGRWVAFTSNAGGTWEIYVRRLDGSDPHVQVSREGGRIPFWSRSGQLFYRTHDQRIMVADYRVAGGRIAFGEPRLWASPRLTDTGVLSNLDLAPDGRRFIGLAPVESDETDQAPGHVTLLLGAGPPPHARAD